MRFASDDVDDTCDGVAAVEGRAAAAKHLDAVDHGCGQLVQKVDTSQGAVDGAAVDEDLRVGLRETVDANLV